MSIPQVALASFCRIIQGGRHGLSGNHFVSEGYPAYGAGGLNGLLSTFEFDGDGIVLSAIGARCGKCFRTCARWSSLANTQVILPDPAVADVDYLYHQLNDESSWPRAGTGQPFIKPSSVKARKVRLPPLHEQRRVAAMLREADALRRKRREAIALSEQLIRATFLEIFGDPLTNPNGWSLAEMRVLIADARTGLVRATDAQGPDRHYRYLKMDAIRANGRIDYARATRVDAAEAEVVASTLKAGDLLVNTRNSRELVGKAAVHNEAGTWLYNNNILAVRFAEPAFSVFVSEYLRTDAGSAHVERRKAGTTSVFALYQKDFLTIPVPVPPESLLVRYRQIVDAVTKDLENREQGLAEANRLFEALSDRAFRGEL